MSLRKKIILGVVIAVVVLGTVGGLVAANTDTATTTTTVAENPEDTLLGKVAAKLGVSVDDITAAFQEARIELQQERLDARLAELVADGTITQEQADAFKTWMNSRPSDQEFQDALQTWRDANPLAGLDIPLSGMGNPGGFNRGPGMNRAGMGGPGMCEPGTGDGPGPMRGFGCR